MFTFLGGIFRNEIFLPFADSNTKPSTATKSQPSTSVDAQKRDASAQMSPEKRHLRGFAVFRARARCNLESVKRALLKNKTFLAEVTLLTQSQAEVAGASGSATLYKMAAERVVVTTVNKHLLADKSTDKTMQLRGDVTAATCSAADVSNDAIEAYLQWKLLTSSRAQLSDVTQSALTDVFHSCYVTDEHASVMTSSSCVSESSVESCGFICLSAAQILLRLASNLLASFFAAFAAARTMSIDTVVKDALARFGVARSDEKDA